MLIHAGLSQDRVYVKPNLDTKPPIPRPWHERERKAMFIGWLGNEKGVNFLIETWKTWGINAPTLEIIGDGPEKEKLKEKLNRQVNTR